jgi:hypothetical protein
MAEIAHIVALAADGVGAHTKPRTLFGTALHVALPLCSSAVIAFWDAITDVAVTVSFFLSGDWGWFFACLCVHVVTGCLIGLLHVHSAMVHNREGGGRQSVEAHSDVPRKRVLAHTSRYTRAFGAKLQWLLGATIGMLGLAPVVVSVMALREHGDRADKDAGTYDADTEEKAEETQEAMLLAKVESALELVLESLPQAVLQTYIGISYGDLSGGSDDLGVLIAFSVLCSFLSSGDVMFELEAEDRNKNLPREARLTLFSAYGLVTVIGRAGQVAALVFGNALCACAFKGWAVLTSLLSIANLLFLTMYSKIQARGNGSRFSPNQIEIMQYSVHIIFVVLLLGVFYLMPHVDNNYADRTVQEDGSASSAQHFECRKRTVGLSALLISLAVSVVFMSLSLILDQEWGLRSSVARRRELLDKRDQEDAAEESRVAAAYVQAHRECSDTELADPSFLVRTYRRMMLEDISRATKSNCQAHCRATGQGFNLEAEWKFRQRRKLRWESSSYFLVREYRAWDWTASAHEDHLQDVLSVDHPRMRGRLVTCDSNEVQETDNVNSTRDDYDELFRGFLAQTYAHPRCYKWEENALWEASAPVRKLTEGLAFSPMYIRKRLGFKHSQGCRRSVWEKSIFRLDPKTWDQELDGRPRLECFDVDQFNSRGHSFDKSSALVPEMELYLDGVTHCRDPRLNPHSSRSGRHALHAIELVSPRSSWVFAAETMQAKLAWIHRIAEHLPDGVEVEETLTIESSQELAKVLLADGPSPLTRLRSTISRSSSAVDSEASGSSPRQPSPTIVSPNPLMSSSFDSE